MSKLPGIHSKSGRILTYGFDAGGRVKSLSGTVSAVTQDYATGASYAPHGGLARVTLGSGVLETYTYNERLQLDGLQAGSLSLGYGYGTAGANNGNVRTQTISRGGWSATQTYTYDPFNRLKTAGESSGNWTQTYATTTAAPMRWPR